ncbi:MAG: hypothetical protein ACJ761_00185, partial [Chloroflexota bacterium]
RVGPAPRLALPVPLPLVATNQPPVQYKGAELDPERGPGLGCFRFQLIVLAVLLVLTPLSVAWQWPVWLSTLLLVIVLVLLLVAGQTVIFLLRLVAADRRSRRRPLGSATRTVGEIEDAGAAAAGSSDSPSAEPRDDKGPDSDASSSGPPDPPPADGGPVRQ